MKNLSNLMASALINSANIEEKLAEAIQLNPNLAVFLANALEDEEKLLEHLKHKYYDRINFKITKIYFNKRFENTIEYEYDEVRYVQNENDVYYKSSSEEDETYNIKKLFHFNDKDIYKLIAGLY